MKIVFFYIVYSEYVTYSWRVLMVSAIGRFSHLTNSITHILIFPDSHDFCRFILLWLYALGRCIVHYSFYPKSIILNWTSYLHRYIASYIHIFMFTYLHIYIHTFYPHFIFSHHSTRLFLVTLEQFYRKTPLPFWFVIFTLEGYSGTPS